MGRKRVTYVTYGNYAEAFKTCKNTIKLINLCALPCLGLGLWLTLTVYFDLT